MLNKVLAKLKQNIPSNDQISRSQTHGTLPTATTGLVKVDVDFTKLQDVIELLLSQSRNNEDAINALIDKLGKITTSMSDDMSVLASSAQNA